MKTVLITGANKGLGLEFCKQYQAQGWDVVAVCRKTSSQLQQLSVKTHTGLELTEPSSIEAFAEKINANSLDLLIHNAGMMIRDQLDHINWEQIITQFKVNAMAPLFLTQKLLPALKTKAKVCIISSRMGSISDNKSGGYYGYRMSKTAANMVAKSLSHDLSPKQISVGILHPGFVRTDMTGQKGNISALESVEALIKRIEEQTIVHNGIFRLYTGDTIPF